MGLGANFPQWCHFWRLFFKKIEPSTEIVLFCVCPVLPEWPDGENYRNLSRAQLHRHWTDITRWQMLQCLPRYVFPPTALFAVALITLWTCTHQSPATVRRTHLCNNFISLPAAPGMNASWLGYLSEQTSLSAIQHLLCQFACTCCFGREVLQGK